MSLLNLPFRYLSFKDRIALHYLLATATLVALTFLVVFFVVKRQVYADLDYDLRFEATKHLGELVVGDSTLQFRNKGEWLEREHREVQVNPVFIQLNDARGRFTDKSPNLKTGQLEFDPARAFRRPFNAVLRGTTIRQLQIPLPQQGRPVGYLLAAIPLDYSQRVINSLKLVLLLSFPVVLAGLFLVTRLLAGRSIQPIKAITATTDRITKNNLTERIELPRNHDELYQLTLSINDLLARIEQALAREKQFTADASHELRTPLAVLKGTLEVLVRKPRTGPEYVENITRGIREIDRLTHIVDQLLLLARFEKYAQHVAVREIDLAACIHEALWRLRHELETKQIHVDLDGTPAGTVAGDPYLTDLILDNLLANAIKYSPAHSTITIGLSVRGSRVACAIADQGIGINPANLGKIFDPLYRSDALQHKHIEGSGLGLSIVAKASALLGIELTVASELGQGSTFTLLFPARPQGRGSLTGDAR